MQIPKPLSQLGNLALVTGLSLATCFGKITYHRDSLQLLLWEQSYKWQKWRDGSILESWCKSDGKDQSWSGRLALGLVAHTNGGDRRFPSTRQIRLFSLFSSSLRSLLAHRELSESASPFENSHKDTGYHGALNTCGDNLPHNQKALLGWRRCWRSPFIFSFDTFRNDFLDLNSVCNMVNAFNPKPFDFYLLQNKYFLIKNYFVDRCSAKKMRSVKGASKGKRKSRVPAMPIVRLCGLSPTTQ